jgi:hypothetical protein
MPMIHRFGLSTVSQRSCVLHSYFFTFFLFFHLNIIIHLPCLRDLSSIQVYWRDFPLSFQFFFLNFAFPEFQFYSLFLGLCILLNSSFISCTVFLILFSCLLYSF